MKKEKYSSGLLLLLLMTLIVRGGVLFYDTRTFKEDPDNYRQLAENLEYYGVFGKGETATAYRPPLYPELLRESFRFTKDAPLTSFPQKAVPKKGSDPLADLIAKIPPDLLLTRTTAIALFHWILGLLSVLCVWETAKNLRMSRSAALFAGFLVAVDPILLQQSRLVMTETLAAFFASAILLLTVRFYTRRRRLTDLFFLFFLGIILGIASLCRPAFLGFAVMIAFFLLILKKPPKDVAEQQKIDQKIFEVPEPQIAETIREQKPEKKSQHCMSFHPVYLIAFLAGLAIFPGLWTQRNYQEFKQIIPTTTHAGYTFLLANNALIYDHNQKVRPWETFWNAEEFHKWWKEKLTQTASEQGIQPDSKEMELLQDRLAKQEGINIARKRPKDFMRAMGIRIGNLWQCLPYRTDLEKPETDMVKYGRYSIGIFYAIEILFMILGYHLVLFRKREAHLPCGTLWIWVFLLILSVQIPHLFFWTNMRMRAPLVVAIALFAASVFSRKKKASPPK
ncbi:MAG: phospholipid carrier-dependent glycosyltransferase [Planctomycetia bacterium]|nr:phospholipid carrier-dependent glycosyltransferase [Planctomycetia bacterium]